MLIDLTQQGDKLVFGEPKKRCHCEERSDVAIPRIFRNVRKTDKRPNEPPGIVGGLPRPLKRTGLAMTALFERFKHQFVGMLRKADNLNTIL